MEPSCLFRHGVFFHSDCRNGEKGYLARLWYQRWRILPDAEGYLLDFLPAKTALQTVKDFFLPVVDNFVQPNVAVHFYEESAVAKTNGDGVSGDGWIHGFGPNTKDFCF